jgi:hypothetical protein
LAASWLNLLVCTSQTGVSTEIITLKTFTLPSKSASVIGAPRPFSDEKSGALSPTLTSDPISVSGFPFKVTTPVLSSASIEIPPDI